MFNRIRSRASEIVFPQARGSRASSPAARPGIFEPLESRRLLAGDFHAFEAEAFTGQSAGSGSAAAHTWASFSDPTAGGGTGLLASPNSGVNVGDSTVGPRRDYAINFTNSGTYYVWVRMSGPSGSDDSLHVGLDGALASGGAQGVALATAQRDGDWHWIDRKSNGVRLTVNVTTTGVHTFNLWMREDGARADEFILTKDAAFNPDSGGGSANTTGSLSDPNPLAGPVHLRFDDREFQDATAVWPLSDGDFYIRGFSSSDPYNYPQVLRVTRLNSVPLDHYVTRHNPDGSIDRSFGNDGRLVLTNSSLLRNGEVIAAKTAGFFHMLVDSTAGSITVTRLDNQLNVVSSFGDAGKVTLPYDQNRDLEPLSNGGFAMVLGFDVFQFDAIGSPDGTSDLESFITDGKFNADFPRLGSDASNRLYIAWDDRDELPGQPPDRAFNFVNVYRLLPSLEADSSYATNGLSRTTESQLDGDSKSVDEIYVSEEGRAVLGTYEHDGDLATVSISDNGDWLAVTDIYGNIEFPPFSRGFIKDIRFLDDGEFAIAFTGESASAAVVGRSDSGGSYDFGVIHPGPNGNLGAVNRISDAHRPVRAYDAALLPDGTFVFAGYQEFLTFEPGSETLVTDIDHTAAIWRIDPAHTYQEANGRVDVEAEAWTGQTGLGWLQVSDPDAGDGQALEAVPNRGVNFGESTSGPGHDYAINFTNTGTYYVWVRMAGASGSDDSLHVGLDGALASGGAQGVQLSSAQRNDQWHWIDRKSNGVRVTVNVTTPGIHNLNLWMREDGTKVDRFILTKNASFNPNTGGGFQEANDRVDMQAESSTGQSPGSGSAAGHTWATFSDGTAGGGSAVVANPNSGVNVGDSTSGPRRDYSINFTNTGTYYIWVRMKGASGSDDSLHVGMNGTAASFGAQGIALDTAERGTGWHWKDKNSAGTRVTVNVTSAGIRTFNLWMREDGMQVDQFILTKDAAFNPNSGGGSANTIGSLNGPSLLSGPVRVTFDERSWHEVDGLLPRSDGDFYVIGRSGLDNQPYPHIVPARREAPTATQAFVTRHNPDGSIDRSFGDNGRKPLSEIASNVIPSPAGGFFGLGGGNVTRYTDDLTIDTSFGGGDGKVAHPPVPTQFEALAGGGYALFSDGKLYRYDSAGNQSPNAVFDLQGLVTPETTSSGPIRLDSDGAGRLYVSWTSEQPHPSVENQLEYFVNTARITQALSLDTSYATDGVARFHNNDISVDRYSISDLFVGPDGRAAIELREADGDVNVGLLDPDGAFYGRQRVYGALDSDPAMRGDIVEVAFGDNGEVATAFIGESVTTAVVGRTSDGRGSHDFGFIRFDANGAWIADMFVNDPDMPTKANDVFVDEGGDFIFGGFVEDVTVETIDQTPFVTDIDHAGGLWRITDTYQETGGKVELQAEDSTDRAFGTGSAEGHVWRDGGSILEADPNVGLNLGDSTSGPRRDYAIKFNTTGTFYVWVRMAGANGNDDSLHVGLDGVLASGGAQGVALSSAQRNGDWHWIGRKSNGVRLTVNVTTPGVHTFNLWMREDGARVDEFILTKDAAFTPGG